MNEWMIHILKWTGTGMGSGFVLLLSVQKLVTTWSIWTSLGLLFGVGATATGFATFRRLQSRRKEHRVTPKAPSVIPPSNSAKRIAALRANWKSAMRCLQKSELRKRGNPIYALPWYMMLGAEGTGKTSALRNARLSSFANSPSVLTDSPTAQCDWSFFDECIVIDTAGRYAMAEKATPDFEEWHTFLDLLMKCRTREPLNGLTLAVSAKQLTGDKPELLEHVGASLRQRIDELMRAVGARFPVYVLVTQCDALPGMTAFFECLSDRGREQAMGCLNEDARQDAEPFLDTVFATVGPRLKNLRLALAAQPNSNIATPEVLVFPDTFQKLRLGLSAFMKGAFQASVYQETPYLRGLHFAGQSFLHDFFSRVLPADRALSTPTRSAQLWRRGTMNLGFMTWGVLWLTLASMLSYSFVKNMKTLTVLRESHRQFLEPKSAKPNLVERLQQMDGFQRALLDAEDHQKNAWLASFGLHDVKGVETSLKNTLSVAFRRELLAPTDEQYRDAIERMTFHSSDSVFSRFVGHLVARLTVLRNRFSASGRGETSGDALVLPFLRLSSQETDQETKDVFVQLYVNSVRWASDSRDLQSERLALQTYLKRLLSLKGTDPRWLIAWAEAQNQLPKLTLHQLWGGKSTGNPDASVSGLFSAEGKDRIGDFFQEIEQSLSDPAISRDLRARFERWYGENASNAWRQFLADFPNGKETLSSAEAWRQAASHILQDSSPYSALENRIIGQFANVPDAEVPAWVMHVRQARDLRRSPAYWKYRQSLEKIVTALSDSSQAVQATAKAFDNANAPSESLFGAAFDALAKLKRSAPTELANDSVAWTLISGPLDFLWETARLETAEKLQSDWQSKVLAAATGLEGSQAMPVIVGKDGPAMQFAKELAAPFIQWKPGRGFCAKEVYGGSVPFTSQFFSFLNGAVWVSSIHDLQVGITATTPETNADAKRIPHVSRLTLRCGGKKLDQVLSNRRLRVLEKVFDTADKSFRWTPACSETLLEIDLAGNHLVKSYPGSYGFFAFLHDFKSGKHTFSRHDFPDQEKSLAELGVKSITMHYRVKGAPDYVAPKSAPASIVKGWTR